MLNELSGPEDRFADARPDAQEARENLDQAIEYVCNWLIEEKGCVLFLGAAFSARDEQNPHMGGVPSSEELLRILKQGPNEKLSAVLEKKYGDAPPGGLKRFLEEHFLSNKGTTAKPKDAHLRAAQLPFRTVITTNCDNLMEIAYDGAWKAVAHVVLDEDLPKVGTKDVTLVKPHGCVLESNENCFVFTKSQYVRFSDNRPQLVNWLTAVLATHPVLFLGYGIKDTNIIQVIKSGLKSESLKRNSRNRYSEPRNGYAVMGNRSRPDFAAFQLLVGIGLVEVGVDEFMEALVKEYSRRAHKDHTLDCIGVMNEAKEDAPKQFIENCQMGSLVPDFPYELLNWKIESQSDKDKTQDWCQRFIQEGLLDPTMKFGEQWYRFHRGIVDCCLERLRNSNKDGERLRDRVKDYSVFLTTKEGSQNRPK